MKMKFIRMFLYSLACLSLFVVAAIAQEKQDLDDGERFKVKGVCVTLENGEKLSFSGEEFGGLMCGQSTAGLTVFWLVKKDQDGVQLYQTAPKDYLFRRDLNSDKRIKRNLDAKVRNNSKNLLLEVEDRLINLEKMVGQLLRKSELPYPPPAAHPAPAYVKPSFKRN